MRILLLLITLTFTLLHSWSQTITTGHTDHICGTDERHAFRMEKDPAYKSSFLRQKAIFDSIKVAPASVNRQLPSVMTIPVVVHVVHLGERVGSQTNISDDQIYGAIDGLNERFANVNGQGIDIEINFCLATRDPNGCPTSGINRVDGSVVQGYREEGVTWDHECGVDEVPIKDLSKWPTWDYYNIWVVHDICGNVAGYAYYPNGDEYDGTVIDVASMRYENSTLAHELGHGLNIRHTFSGEEDDECPLNDDCMEDGDEICDTPPHRRGDCAIHINPCTTEGIWLNSLNNWMSYCFPSAGAGLFTEGQRTRMWDAMSVEPRSALLLSQGCANAVAMKFTSDAGLMCPYDTRTLTAQPAGGYFQIASGSGYIQDSILTPTGGNEIVIEYIIEQAACTSSVFQQIPIRTVPNSLLRSAQDTLCIGQSTTLQGYPSGGTFSIVSGPGTLDSNLLISDGAGVIELAYEKLFSGCYVRDSHVVASFNYPIAAIEPLSDEILTAVPDSGTFQWVRCDQDYEHVADATNAVLQASSSGSYAVVSISGNCRDTSDCIVVMLTSTHADKSNDALKIYPNPVNDIFYLDGISQNDDVEITLSDIRGVQLTSIIYREGNRMKVDISTFPSGVYVMHVYQSGVGYQLYRIVKV